MEKRGEEAGCQEFFTEKLFIPQYARRHHLLQRVSGFVVDSHSINCHSCVSYAILNLIIRNAIRHQSYPLMDRRIHYIEAATINDNVENRA